MPIFGYPHSNYSEIDLDYVIKLVRQNNGLHLDISGNQLLLKTLDGTTVSSVTVHYAETAGHADTATTANTATFATTASTATSANTATEASHALTADNATTAGTATTANSATTASTANNAVHATSADTALLANRATLADNATHADTTDSVVHAEKAVETITVSGNTVVFRTYDGTEYTVTIPYAVKANKDDLGNVIKNTYFTNVVDNNGTLEFKDAEGNTLVSLVPSSETAKNDTYNNLIADYIKTIAVSSNSNYVTITHGTGTADTVIIHYAETAWKDTNDNVIKNTYIKSLGMVEDSDTGHYNLVAYNGDTPTAELFRLELIAYRSQIADEATHASTADYATSAGHASTADNATTADHATIADTTPNGDTIQSYAKSVSTNTTTYGVQHLVLKDGDNNVIKDVNLFERSTILIGFFDKDQTNPDDIYSITVNQTVTYTVDADVLGWYKFTEVNDMLQMGVFTGYINSSDQMIQRVSLYYSNGYWYFNCFDHTTSDIKVFRCSQGTLQTDFEVTRVL